MRYETLIALALLCITSVYARENYYSFYSIKNIDNNRNKNNNNNNNKAATQRNPFQGSLFKTLAKKNEKENFVVSSLSVQYLLTLIALGADGRTLKELCTALGIKQSLNNTLHEYKTEFMDQWKEAKYATVKFANLVVSKNRATRFFSQAVKDAGSSLFEKLDANPSKSISRINKWVSHQTNDKITELVQPGEIDRFTELVLLNAIYFKSDWAYKFNMNLNELKEFYAYGEKKMVQMMEIEANFRNCYDRQNFATYLELPYSEEHWKMVIVLPDEDNTLPNIESTLNLIKYEKCQANSPEKIKVYLPKFKIESKIDLQPVLESMNIRSLFSKNQLRKLVHADLSVKSIKQKALIEVDKDGSTAAAATGAVITFRMLEPRSISVNRPFYFAIQFKGRNVFEGHVISP